MFEGKFEIDENGCHVWSASRCHRGHGRYRGGHAHRALWEQHNGPVPSGLVVRHLCNNPACVNLSHLELGGIHENKWDELKRQWATSIGGGFTDLREVLHAKMLTKVGVKTGVIADYFGVDSTTISQIKHGKTYRELSHDSLEKWEKSFQKIEKILET